VRTELRESYNIEIGGGLGELAGKIWRIGLMGESARAESVLSLLAALEEIFGKSGRPVPSDAAQQAATNVYDG